MAFTFNGCVETPALGSKNLTGKFDLIFSLDPIIYSESIFPILGLE